MATAYPKISVGRSCNMCLIDGDRLNGNIRPSLFDQTPMLRLFGALRAACESHARPAAILVDEFDAGGL